MRPRRYTIVIADRATGVVRRFTIALLPTVATIASVLMLPVLIGLGARWSAQSAIDELARANTLLQVENASYKEATGELSLQVASLQDAFDEIGARAIVDPQAKRAMEKLPAAVRNRAMGGASASEVAALGAAFAGPEAAFHVLRNMLGLIESRLDSVRMRLEKRQALAAATPSIWPVPGWLSSDFGRRRDPFTGESGFHPGLDISADKGEPVRASADGIVESAGPNGAYGNMVVIDHGYGITTRYGHLSRFAAAPQQRVRRGEVIGYVGSTGRSTSPHLHYEVLVNGQLTDPMSLLSTR